MRKIFTIFIISIYLFSLSSIVLSQEQQTVITIDTTTAFFQFEAFTKDGRRITDLQQTEIQVLEKNKTQEINYFKQTEEPMMIGFIVDASGSMKSIVENVKDALRAFKNTIRPNDETFLVIFQRYEDPELLKKNQHVEDNHFWISDGFNNDLDYYIEILNKFNNESSSPIYDALHAGLEKAKLNNLHKKIIILISDGQESRSEHTKEQTMNRLAHSGIQVYPITIFAQKPTDDLIKQGRGLMREIAKTTRTSVFESCDPTDISNGFLDIFEEARKSYVIGIVPKVDGREHKINIKIFGRKDIKIVLPINKYIGAKTESDKSPSHP